MKCREGIIVTQSNDPSKMSRQYRRLLKRGKIKETSEGFCATVLTPSREREKNWFIS
jgi:hypothetical protein